MLAVRIVDQESGVCKLSKKQIETLQSKATKANRVQYSKIEDYRDIVDIIKKNKPKELEEEQKLLINKGAKADLKPLFIRLSKDCKIISVLWRLIWIEVED